MALTKQNVYVPLGTAGGTRRDIADIVLPLGQGSLGLYNLFVDRQGEVRKRPGSSPLSSALVGGGGNIPTPWQLATYQAAAVSLAYQGQDPIQIYSPDAGKWANGTSPTTGHTVDTEHRGPTMVTNVPVDYLRGADFANDVAYGSGYLLVGFEAGTFAIFKLLDAVTKQTIREVEVTGRHPHCVITGGKAVGIYVKADGHLTTSVIDLSTLAVTTTNINALPSATTILDVWWTGSTSAGFVAAYQDGANAIRETVFTSGLVATDYTAKDAGGASMSPGATYTFGYVQPLSDSGAQRSMVTFDNVNGCRVHYNLTTSGANQQAATTVVLDASANVAVIRNCTAHTITATPTDVQVLWEFLSSTTPIIRQAQRLSGVTTVQPNLAPLVSLASKAWKVGTDFYYLGLASNTLFVLRTSYSVNNAPQARALLNAAATENPGSNSVGKGYLSGAAIVAGSPTVYQVAVTRLLRVEPIGSSTSEASGVDLLSVSYPTAGVAPTVGRPVEAIGALFVPTGGQLMYYDGRNYMEAGFPYPPVITAVTNSTIGGAGLTLLATYRYVAVYARYDATGAVWRSSTSIPYETTLAGTQNAATLAITPMTVSGGDLEITWIEIYRSAANETSVLTLVARVQNDPTATTVGYVDIFSDTDIDQALPLYTTGGLLDADTLPPTGLVLNALNRLWIVDAEDPTKLWVSNRFVDGDGVRVSEDTAIVLRDVSALPITALAAVDDKVIVFKSDRIYVITGEGADAAGVGGFFVQTCAIGVGTINPQSVIAFPFGVVFQSAHGYQLLDRGLSLSSPIPGTTHIGQPIEDLYGALTIVSAVHLPERAQIRLYNRSAFTLVLDYHHWAWSIYTDQTVNAATVYLGRGLYFDTVHAAVMAEGDAVFREDVTSYLARVVLPIISANAIGGWERVYRVQGIGRTISDHAVSVALAADGSTSAYGTLGRTVLASEIEWPWEVRPPREKLSALQLTISVDCVGEGPVINGVALVVGLKQGLRKLPASARAV